VGQLDDLSSRAGPETSQARHRAARPTAPGDAAQPFQHRALMVETLPSVRSPDLLVHDRVSPDGQPRNRGVRGDVHVHQLGALLELRLHAARYAVPPPCGSNAPDHSYTGSGVRTTIQRTSRPSSMVASRNGREPVIKYAGPTERPQTGRSQRVGVR
jgi:hypothetical protein